MNTEYLRYFELAYKEGNFSAAARRVPVSPQGLTKAIHTLEKDLGVTLFDIDPDTGSPVPTEYSHELFQFVQVFDSNIRLLNDAFDAIRGRQVYTVRVGCSLGVLGTFGPEFIGEFHRANPNVNVETWEAADDIVAQNLAAGTCELALLVGECPPGLMCQELYRCRQYFWVNASDPLAQRPELTMADVAGRDVAIPGSGFDCYRRLLADASACGIELGGVYQMSEIFQLYEFAASGRGLGFSVEHLVHLPVFERDTQVVPVPLADTTWHFGIAHLATHALVSAESRVWNYCLNRAKALRGQ